MVVHNSIAMYSPLGLENTSKHLREWKSAHKVR